MADKITELREKINNIDERMVDLFEQRMRVSAEVGDYKREHNMAIYDPAREDAVITKARSLASSDITAEVGVLMRSLMALSREYQRNRLLSGEHELIPPAEAPISAQEARVVYPGAPGAWSEQAALKIFPGAEPRPLEYFEDVIEALGAGRADFGVLPIENSRSGAIGETYDLLRRFGLYVTASCVIPIRHTLMAKPGSEERDIRKVISHPEGFRQCRRYLTGKHWDQIVTSNTAAAAREVSESQDRTLAAIGSALAAERYGLSILAEDIIDAKDNATIFFAVRVKPEYDEAADRISLAFSLAHRTGSLAEALLPFMAAGINLTRIESRPASKGSYRFFAEIEGNIEDPLVIETLRHAEGATEYLEVLGCFRSVTG